MSNLPVGFRGESVIEQYDAGDLWFYQNPELASFAYAYRDRLIRPEILPTFSKFRELQAAEKISFGEQLTQRIISADQRAIQFFEVESDVEKQRLATNSLEEVTREVQSGLTRRELAKIDGALKTQMMKYDWRKQVVDAHLQGQKYLSDNELEATRIEAEAIGTAIMFTVAAQRDVRLGVAHSNLLARSQEAQYEYLTKIAEAESIRGISVDNNNARIIEQYLQSQVEIFRISMMLEIAREHSISQFKIESQKTAQVAIAEASRILSITKKTRAIVRDTTGKNSFGIEIIVSD